MRFSLVIPCFNEAKNIPLLVESCKFMLTETDIELILVNNGSSDETDNIIADLKKVNPFLKSVSVEENIGYGHGILKGLENASGKILGWTHADMQTDPKDILKGLKLFSSDESVNFIKGKRINRPLKDNIFTIGMSIFETILLHAPMHDINAQPTMFKRKLYETWSNPPHDFSLDLYAYYLAIKNQNKIKRFNVNFNERVHGTSNWNINWRSKWRFIIRTIKYSLKLRRQL
jgi:glycosyltransferase involved in cell wall biosynthesis